MAMNSRQGRTQADPLRPFRAAQTSGRFQRYNGPSGCQFDEPHIGLRGRSFGDADSATNRHTTVITLSTLCAAHVSHLKFPTRIAIELPHSPCTLMTSLTDSRRSPAGRLADAMSSSLLIDPEVLEWRYPVRLKPHLTCTARGGAGRWRGSNGEIRRIRFVRP